VGGALKTVKDLANFMPPRFMFDYDANDDVSDMPMVTTSLRIVIKASTQ